MNFDKEFSDIYYECCCAGAAGGANCISSFAPENNKGVVDIHEKDDKFIESKKIKESMEHPYDILIARKESEKGKSIEDKWRHADEVQINLDRVNDFHLYKVCPIFDGAVLYYWHEDGSIDNIDEHQLGWAVERFIQGYKDFDIEIADKRLLPILSKSQSDLTNKKLFESDDFGNPITESKMKESFDFEDDDDLGYDDFDYEGEMEDYYNPREYWPENAMEQMWAEEDDDLIADSGIPVVKSNIFGKDTDNLSDEYMDMLDVDLGVEKAVDHSSVYDYDKLEPSEIAIDPKLLGESKVMPRSIRESRALIGGSLESKEKTDYENTLEEHNKKRSYNKTVDSIDQKLTGVDSGAHGKHEWTGELKNE